MVRIRFRGRLSCQLSIDRRMPVHDPPGSGSAYQFTIHDLKFKLLRTSAYICIFYE